MAADAAQNTIGAVLFVSAAYQLTNGRVIFSQRWI